MNKILYPNIVECHPDTMDSCGFYIHTGQEYFFIQVSLDDELNEEPYIEINDQSNGQYGGLEKIIFFENKIIIVFSDKALLMKEIKTLEIHYKITDEIIYFFKKNLKLENIVEIK